jgi:hypothetical protein
MLDTSQLDVSQITVDSVEDTIGEWDDNENPNPQSKPTYSHLRPKKRLIPEDQIQSEWRRLKPPAQEKVRDLLTTVKRGVVSTAGAGNEKKMQEADEALDGFIRKLTGKIPAMPFPPKTREVNFDLDRLTEQGVSITTANMIDTDRHSAH